LASPTLKGFLLFIVYNMTMRHFDYIALIYNPNSTGDAEGKAKRLAQAIARRQKAIGVRAVLVPTEYAGHAIELAKQISLRHKRPLLVSVSGDGGFNEVVNGAMQAKQEQASATPVVAVLGAGNANDHKRATRGTRTLISFIANGRPRPIDLLLLRATKGRKTTTRFAHGYISLGLTSDIAKDLNGHEKGIMNETQLILKTFRSFTPVTIIRKGQRKTLHNLVFANIHTMAKVVRLDSKLSVQDGRFEVIELAHHSQVRMALSLLRAIVFGFRNPPSASKYSFSTVEDVTVQLDGETEDLEAGSFVVVECRQQAVDSLF